jgi:hypothetical protein
MSFAAWLPFHIIPPLKFLAYPLSVFENQNLDVLWAPISNTSIAQTREKKPKGGVALFVTWVILPSSPLVLNPFAL